MTLSIHLVRMLTAHKLSLHGGPFQQGHANLRSTVGTPSLWSIFRQLNFSISSKFPCPSLVLFFFLQFPIYFPRLTAFFFASLHQLTGPLVPNPNHGLDMSGRFPTAPSFWTFDHSLYGNFV